LAVYSQKAVIKIKFFKKLCFSFRFSIARIWPEFKKNHQVSIHTWFK
jgi:hypothetical protein